MQDLESLIRDFRAIAGLAKVVNDWPPVVILPAIPGGNTESDTEDERVINHG